jgi:hypothetical protein
MLRSLAGTDLARSSSGCRPCEPQYARLARRARVLASAAGPVHPCMPAHAAMPWPLAACGLLRAWRERRAAGAQARARRCWARPWRPTSGRPSSPSRPPRSRPSGSARGRRWRARRSLPGWVGSGSHGWVAWLSCCCSPAGAPVSGQITHAPAQRIRAPGTPGCKVLITHAPDHACSCPAHPGARHPWLQELCMHATNAWRSAEASSSQVCAHLCPQGERSTSAPTHMPARRPKSRRITRQSTPSVQAGACGRRCARCLPWRACCSRR